jgi:hypothetical protein
MTVSVNQHRVALEAARQRYEAETAELKASASTYRPEALARLQGEAYMCYSRAIRDIAAAATTARAEAEQELAAIAARAETADPLTTLLPSEQERAANRALFVKEDFAELPLAQLAQRVEDVLRGSDRVEQALVLRYGRRFLAVREEERGVQRGEHGRMVATGTERSDDEARVAVALDRLALRFADPRDADRRRATTERLEAVQALLSETVYAEHQLKTYAPRPPAGFYATV